MKIEVFALCDAATADFGKLSILGAFDTIWVAKTPAMHPQCTIALRARFEKPEGPEHRFSVHFVDASGGNVIPPWKGNMTINFSDEQSSSSTNLILNIQGVKLEKIGTYSVDLFVNDQHQISLPLFVKGRKQ
jgi:hypothetical protein